MKRLTLRLGEYHRICELLLQLGIAYANAKTIGQCEELHRTIWVFGCWLSEAGMEYSHPPNVDEIERFAV